MTGRDNGLRAETYEPLADLDPRLADAMLERLRDSHIAAYAIPAGSELSGHFGTRLPERPTDRLYVDAEATEPAWQVLRTHLPSMDVEREGGSSELSPGQQEADRVTGADEGRDEDEVWREIIDAYDTEPSGPVPPWPASEDLDEAEKGDFTGDQASEENASHHGRVIRQPEYDPDEHFVPPPPPPVPRPDPVTAVSWLGLFGGPAYLLLATMLDWNIPGWAAFVSVAAFVGGFVTLVVRMGDHPPPDSGPDDGAVL